MWSRYGCKQTSYCWRSLAQVARSLVPPQPMKPAHSALGRAFHHGWILDHNFLALEHFAPRRGQECRETQIKDMIIPAGTYLRKRSLERGRSQVGSSSGGSPGAGTAQSRAQNTSSLCSFQGKEKKKQIHSSLCPCGLRCDGHRLQQELLSQREASPAPTAGQGVGAAQNLQVWGSQAGRCLPGAMHAQEMHSWGCCSLMGWGGRGWRSNLFIYFPLKYSMFIFRDSFTRAAQDLVCWNTVALNNCNSTKIFSPW